MSSSRRVIDVARSDRSDARTDSVARTVTPQGISFPTVYLTMGSVVADPPCNRRAAVAHWRPTMVAVVQLVERQVVVLDVAGSSPVGPPTARQWSGSAARVHCRARSRL